MLTQPRLFELLEKGSIEGFSSSPRVVETVLSRVYVFETEGLVLKMYKRDNAWWNSQMYDLSGGSSRRMFIENDFAFNHMLSPSIYLRLQTFALEGDRLCLEDLNGDEDELVMVMKCVDMNTRMTHVLTNGTLSLTSYEEIGQQFARAKLRMPAGFLPDLEEDWYAQMRARLEDLASWIHSVPAFSQEVGEAGIARLRQWLEHRQEKYQSMRGADLAVCLDCHVENVLWDGETLSYMDAFPPKNVWLSGVFSLDVFRFGADVWAFAGKDAYEAYLLGAREAAGDKIDMDDEAFFLLYGALVDGPYFSMLAEKDAFYFPHAKKYFALLTSQLS